METTVKSSPRFRARVAGVLYFLEMLTGGFALYVGLRLFVSGNAGATATSILAHESLFQLGFTANLVQFACYIAVTGLLYDLMRPVSRRLSLIAALFSIVGCTIGVVSCVFEIAPLTVLGGSQYLNVFNVEQLQSLALLFIKLYGQCFNISFVFFGFYCLLIGYLIFRSTFLPPILGVLMAIAGLGWLTFLSPPLASYLSPYILAAGIGEVALVAWLLVMGVNESKWEAKARLRS